MKVLTYSFAAVLMASTAANAQSTSEADGAAEGAAASAAEAPADPAGEATAAPADAAAASAVTDAEIDSFAKATVKLQAIQEDAAIAADQKQTAMAAAVAEAGLDPAKYNEIGKAAAADAILRAKVQTAMSKYAPQPSEG